MRKSSAISLIAALTFASATAFAEAIDIEAREYVLIDFQTGAVLGEKNADERMPPSSMSKLMTAYMVFERLKSGQLSLDDEMTVSENAWKLGGAASGGSTMFLNPNDRVKVEDLLRGMIIQSGNDACIVLAEGIAGSEEAFAEAMTAKAKEIGLTGSHFMNATGLPHPEHYMTPKDLSILARRLITEFPEYYSLYSETSFTYNGITQGNRNPLLYKVGSGADGLKTGHTDAAGYGLTASAIRNGRRLIMVANGMASIKARDSETSKLIDWGFREFTNRVIFKAGDKIADAEVWLGDKPSVPLIVPQDLTLTLPRGAVSSLVVKAVYEGPLPAPVTQGSQAGKVVISAKEFGPMEIPIVTAGAVDRLGFVGRLKAAAQYIFLGPPTPAGPPVAPAPAASASQP